MNDDELLAGLRRAAKEKREGDEPAGASLDDAAAERLAARLAPMLPRVPAATTTPPRRGKVLTFVLPAAAALAIAASAVLFLRTTGGGLPAYAAEVTGERDVRGATDGERPRVARGGRLSIVARPATQVDGPVAARAWIVSAGATRPFAGTIEIADRGAVRLVASPTDTATLTPGEATVLVAVGRPSSLPAEAPTADAADYRRLAVGIIVTP